MKVYGKNPRRLSKCPKKIPVGDPFFKVLAAAPLLSQMRRATFIHTQLRPSVWIRAERLRAAWVKNGNQLPGNVDFPERLLGIPEVRHAQEEASKYFVNMIELQRGVVRRLAEINRRRIRHRYFRIGGSDGGGDGRMHGRHGRPQDMATARTPRA